MNGLARRLWAAVEPLHALSYFAPETADAAREVGLRGWWMGYFAGRLAPAGPVGAATGQALCFVFAPTRVGRALPDAWGYASPEQVLRTRLEATGAALARALPDDFPPEELRALTELLERAADAYDVEDRPLATAWARVPRPGTRAWPERLWLAATVLREHRGDGHIRAAAEHGLTGLDAGVTHAATGLVPAALLRTTRGWTEEEWATAADTLAARGLLTADGRLTPSGESLRTALEARTDALAAPPDPELAERIITRATPLARHLFETAALPTPNPMGLPRPLP
ncbi:hypothetical protein [Streptomyces sp. NPDC048172]|uniref:SCO6745 family protein n=1 Tax=Streptomyces sp. NPDC048172 TaxID=3365505 RepID=UPI003718852E